MSAFNLCLNHSTLAQAFLWLVLPLPLCLLLSHAMPLSGWIIIAPLLLYYYFIWLNLMQRRQVQQLASVDSNGNLHWFAPVNDTGQIKVGGLVSQYVLRLNWYSNNRQALQQQWIFVDQCQPDDFRTLARLISQINWTAETRSNINE